MEVIPEARQAPKKEQSVRVVGVTDGDTLRVVIEGQEVKIRLYGIDAPESGQAFGKASQQALKQITSGRQISIKVLDRDRYGRLVALVFADGANVNEAMVASGFAWAYPQYCKQSFCNEWGRNQTMAKDNRKGLWQDGTPTPPWDWRHRR
ncbi:thermonuclease family protein [Desulfobulbus oligotrophicus]|nr:thermonuclease family protein [Desulfobulbus oligotrophicus]